VLGMSIALMTAAWALDLPTGEKIVLLSLADNANDTGHCWPSMATIAKRAGMTTRGAQLIVQRLEAGGHIHREQVIGKGCNYYIHPSKIIIATPERRSPRTTFAPNETTLTPERRSPKPSGTTITDKKATLSHPKRASKPTLLLPDCIPAQPWADFLEMRKAKGAKPTARAQELLIAKLLRLAEDGHPPGDVLNQSIEGNWTGLFAIKDRQQNGHRNGNGMGGNRLPATRPTESINPRILAGIANRNRIIAEQAEHDARNAA